LPEEVKAKLAEAVATAQAAGKAVTDETALYFRKPDLTEGFTPQKEAPVTFDVYIDDKGAGAMNICG